MMRKVDRRRKARAESQIMRTLASKIWTAFLIPTRFLMRSVVIPLFATRFFQGLVAISCVVGLMVLAKSQILDQWLERPLQSIEIMFPPSPLRTALEAKANEALEASKRRKLPRTAVLQNIRNALSTFPAIESAKIQSSLSGRITVAITLHRIAFAMADKEATRLFFNSSLKVIGTASSRNEILGLEAPPFTLVTEGGRLSTDGGGSARLTRAGGGTHTLNVPFHFRTAHEVLLTLQNAQKTANASLMVTEPPQTLSISEDSGFSACLTTENSELRAFLPPKGCIKLILGPEPDREALSKVLRSVGDLIKRDSPESLDLRIPGRALVKPSDLATRQGLPTE